MCNEVAVDSYGLLFANKCIHTSHKEWVADWNTCEGVCVLISSWTNSSTGLCMKTLNLLAPKSTQLHETKAEYAPLYLEAYEQKEVNFKMPDK